MLCRRCEPMVPHGGEALPDHRRRSAIGVNRLRGFTCERCGVVLPTVDTTESLLEKLSQLALFGLTAEGRPLLESSPERD